MLIRLSCRLGALARPAMLAGCFSVDLSTESDLLMCAVENNNERAVQDLLNAGADVHANHDIAVGVAASKGFTSLTRLLVIEGADFRASNNLALREAAKNGHCTTVQYLLFMGADASDCDSYAILIAVEKENTKMVQMFLEAGYTVPCLKFYIQRCGEKGNIKLMKMLVRHSNKLALSKAGQKRAREKNMHRIDRSTC